MLARKYRAVRAASALARGEGLDSAQLGDAFYDQSHLIREIKRFAGATPGQLGKPTSRSEEHTSELQSLMRISYAAFCLKKNTNTYTQDTLTYVTRHTTHSREYKS